MARLEDELARFRDLVDHGGLVDGAGLLGVELEFHLIDQHGRPSWSNAEVLGVLADGPLDLQTELARFNVELNLPPVALDRPAGDGAASDGGDAADGALSTIRRHIETARRAASAAVPAIDAVSIGTLPTLGPGDVTPDAISDRGRYHELDASIMGARGGGIELDIDGRDAGGEVLRVTLDTILLEAAATSLQIHLDLPADGFVAAWNAAQAIAAVQVAVAANSPVLLGRRLWHETRVPLFEQLIDVRRPEEREPDSPHALPPRVWFGRRWIEHPAELFDENLELFRAPLVADTGSGDGAGDGNALDLAALSLHNGTVWRWNRPVYAAHADRPTLRIENRVLSAPPSAVDATADVALFVGLVAGLRDDVEALTARLPFADADANFRAAARHGLSAELRWPGVRGTTTAGELLADRLIEVAAEGLAGLGVPDAEYGPALDVIAGRASEGRNGAAWQLATLEHEDEHHDRSTALARMLLRYRDLQEEGEPVHRWPWPGTRTA